jgi:archaellum component FlaG (FlaF/FlaG flagellin family)
MMMAAAALLLTAAAAPTPASEDRQIADSLAAMLRAGRSVISSEQARINDPNLGDKGLTGDAVVARSNAIYQQTTGTDPTALDPASRQGRLLNDEIAAIKAVMDANQDSINAKGTGFKGFIPAVFSRLVGEAFSRRAEGEAEMRVTAPLNLVRNRRALPDAWEAQTIATKFLAPDWPHGQSYEATLDEGGKTVFRIAVPEYYAASCLSCHGDPKGAIDITGYPKEGAVLGDLGGVISITLKQ